MGDVLDLWLPVNKTKTMPDATGENIAVDARQRGVVAERSDPARDSRRIARRRTCDPLRHGDGRPRRRDDTPRRLTFVDARDGRAGERVRDPPSDELMQKRCSRRSSSARRCSPTCARPRRTALVSPRASARETPSSVREAAPHVHAFREDVYRAQMANRYGGYGSRRAAYLGDRRRRARGSPRRSHAPCAEFYAGRPRHREEFGRKASKQRARRRPPSGRDEGGRGQGRGAARVGMSAVPPPQSPRPPRCRASRHASRSTSAGCPAPTAPTRHRAAGASRMRRARRLRRRLLLADGTLFRSVAKRRRSPGNALVKLGRDPPRTSRRTPRTRQRLRGPPPSSGDLGRAYRQ